MLSTNSAVLNRNPATGRRSETVSFHTVDGDPQNPGVTPGDPILRDDSNGVSRNSKAQPIMFQNALHAEGKTMNTAACIHLLKALADQTRWRIVNELLITPCSVGNLVERLAVTPYNVSKHVRILREAGIVQTQRQGRNVLCRIMPDFHRRVDGDQGQLDLKCCIVRFEQPVS